MVEKVLGGAMFMVLLAAVAGCGGFSQEKAEARCDQEQFAKAQCVTEKAYEVCVACYKECGDSCEAQATCPEEYKCPSDEQSNADTSTEGQ